MSTHAPYTPGKPYVNEWHRTARPIEEPQDWIAISHARDLTPAIAAALKYLLRDEKPGESRSKDLTKAQEMIGRELDRIGDADECDQINDVFDAVDELHKPQNMAKHTTHNCDYCGAAQPLRCKVVEDGAFTESVYPSSAPLPIVDELPSED